METQTIGRDWNGLNWVEHPDKAVLPTVLSTDHPYLNPLSPKTLELWLFVVCWLWTNQKSVFSGKRFKGTLNNLIVNCASKTLSHLPGPGFGLSTNSPVGLKARHRARSSSTDDQLGLGSSFPRERKTRQEFFFLVQNITKEKKEILD